MPDFSPVEIALGVRPQAELAKLVENQSAGGGGIHAEAQRSLANRGSDRGGHGSGKPTGHEVLTFSPEQVKGYMKYGFTKTKATVSKKKMIRFNNQNYYLTVGADLFSSHKSTPVQISKYNDRLFIFEPKINGILLGEALSQKPYEKPVKSACQPEPSEMELTITFLEQHGMIVNRPALIEIHHKGLNLAMTKNIFHLNQNRYVSYMKKIRQPEKRKGEALFNAFLLDCQNHLRRSHVAPYASHGEI